MAKDTLERKRKLISPTHIIGIGASAGGMEAIHDLFDYMPTNTGFSFVVVQHLSPDYKSLMAELLSKHTAMQVREASNNMAVEPDCIYVIPTKKLISIKNGRLKLDDKLKSRAPNHAIDVFFESLAKDQKKKAVGIILSGTGTDGTKGLAAIKQAGGISVVQDPLTAAFDGMPNSAVESGSADFILPPEMIGEELVAFIKDDSLVKSLKAFSQKDEDTLREILDLLNKTTRQDFNHYKRPTLFRRLAKRMTELNIGSLQQYRDYVFEHEEEIKTLSREFLINVTKFFRDPEAFEFLRTEVIPAIFSNKKPDDTIKAWVVACSSGEEAYSIGILFLEYVEKSGKVFPNIKIFATDIDLDALETASRGVYPTTIQKDVPKELLSKYFMQEGGYFRVTPELRKLVVFANHDVMQDPPFSRLDLITCRNMFIYVNTTLQRKALKKFHFAMNVNSYLMMGPSENIGILKDVTQEVSRKWKVYKCVTKRMDSDTIFSPLENAVYPKLQSPNSRTGAINLTEILKDTLLEDRRVALILIDKEFNVKQAIGSYKSFMRFPEESFNFNLLRMVSPDLAVALGVAVRKAMADNEKATMKNILLHEPDSVRTVNVIVKPYTQRADFQHPFISVLIEDAQEPKLNRSTLSTGVVDNNEQFLALERELNETRENLQAVIEEMETVNEELQSSNEEMISTNEELQSTNEELQSLNEELHTVSAEHQQKIKELFELNDDLNNYFNNSDIGQILVDSHMIIRKFSPSSKRMINLIETDIGRPLQDITSNLRNINFVNEVNKVVKTSKPIEKEVQTEDKYYLMRISPYVRRDKSFDGVVVNFIDISQSKRLTSIIEGIFESSTNGIAAKKAIRDNNNKIIDFEYLAVNEAMERMFNVEHGSLVGKRLLDTFKEGKGKYLPVYINVVETGIPAQLEFYNEHQDKWYETSIVKMLDGIVTTHIDITERKKSADLIAQGYADLKRTSEKLSESNRQLERSNFDLMQFASVASHDLKEPLRKIQAFGNILEAKIKNKLSENELSYFSKMISASNRMQALIDDVLTLSKLSNGNSIKVKTDLNQIIQQIKDDLEITIHEKNAVIKSQPLPLIEAVPGQMHQVFQNLISNALKFGNKKSPTVSITSEPISEEQAKELNIRPADYVQILVSDNGIGFEDEYREKIFGIFQRLHGRNYEGTGIGLAIARKIIENHGGFIVATGRVNKGAKFYIFLPLVSKKVVANKYLQNAH
ncbi:chemotaxis protein CheB [Chryseolinea sp. H1M3-3]|uniref:chemotaxis protein CheB n=1 Tax=Chryseolinea sp. H1M3-3 TaxID=3034144 RepID=UPI0023ED0926|nr:chemotaxis protein CheB [Chryseolinea sp. H1M3-3]